MYTRIRVSCRNFTSLLSFRDPRASHVIITAAMRPIISRITIAIARNNENNVCMLFRGKVWKINVDWLRSRGEQSIIILEDKPAKHWTR